MANCVWTDKRIAELRRLIEAGLSCSQVADLIGDGVSRNAVIGKCHRLGLSISRKPGIHRKPRLPNKPRTALRPSKPGIFATRWGAYSVETKPSVITPTPVADLVPLNITLADIGAFQCRWISSEQPVLFCGHPALIGSWCPTHREIVFTPRTERRVSRKLEMAA